MASCTWLQVGAQGKPCERYTAIIQDVWPLGDVPQEAGNPRTRVGCGESANALKGCDRFRLWTAMLYLSNPLSPITLGS
jgi:hypothetical protein